MKADLLDRPRPDAALQPAPGHAPREREAASVCRRPALFNALLSMFDQAIVSGASFVTAVIIARNLPPEQVGVYYLTLSIVLVLIGVQHTLVAAPYTILYSRFGGAEQKAYTGSTWVHQALLILIAAVGWLAIVGGLLLAGEATISPSLWVLLGAGPLLLLREAVRRFSLARLEIRTAIVLDGVVCGLQLGGLAALWNFEYLSVFTAFGVMAVACALACVGWLVWERGTVRFVRERFGIDWRENWSLAKWGLLSYSIVDTLPNIMPWIVEFSAGAAAAGVLGACGTLVGVTNVFVQGMGNFLRPHAAASYSRAGVPALVRVLVAVSGVFVVVFGAFCVLTLVLGDRLPVFVLGEHFVGAGLIVTALAANTLVASLGMVANSGLWVLRQPKASIIPDLGMLASTLALALVFVGPLGPLGAAVASLLGTSLGMVLKGLALLRAMNVARAEEILPSPQSGDSVLAAGEP